MKICPVRAELFRADGQTDVTKLIVAFRSFANATRNQQFSSSPVGWKLLSVRSELNIYV